MQCALGFKVTLQNRDSDESSLAVLETLKITTSYCACNTEGSYDLSRLLLKRALKNLHFRYHVTRSERFPKKAW